MHTLTIADPGDSVHVRRANDYFPERNIDGIGTVITASERGVCYVRMALSGKEHLIWPDEIVMFLSKAESE